MNFSDYAENKLADMARGQAWSIPATCYLGLASAGTDVSVTELSGTGYARQAFARTLAAWSGTQAAGSTLTSTGTSHATSNNSVINFGTAGSAWGTAAFAVLFDAATGGNMIAYIPIQPARVISSGDPVSFAIGALSVTLGLSGGCSDYLANKLIDFVFRGQSYTWPANLYDALYTSAPSNAGGGTEVSGGGYARAMIASTLAAWSGTQGPGTATASSGTSGRISNNAALAFPVPTADWGAVTHAGLSDAATGGNLLLWAPLAAPKTLSAGAAAPSYDPDARSIRFA